MYGNTDTCAIAILLFLNPCREKAFTLPFVFQQMIVASDQQQSDSNKRTDTKSTFQFSI